MMTFDQHSETGLPESVDVAIVGAGPTGLMLANLLGGYGISVRIIEEGAELIDFPRGVGIDDEALRTFQTVGLSAQVIQHTIPNQRLVFVDRNWKTLAELAPPTEEFGWPRRNGFVQPLADRVLLDGLSRFPSVSIDWASRATEVRQPADDLVELVVEGPSGTQTVRAKYVIGADGGGSSVRKGLGLAFAGTSAPANWLVIDIRNDPMGRPGAFVSADPRRPYVCISIPHGIRRFEFMMLKGEGEQDAENPAFISRLLAPFVVDPDAVEIIRRRVYTHHSRIAERFRQGRVFLAGDAAHVMPVWQGQGYNSAIRDAFNLGWKLTAVLRGLAGEEILDSYEAERHDHVVAMVNLSTLVGRMVSIRNRFVAGLRNVFFRSISVVPAIKTYIVTMRFKPMPTMTQGVITTTGSTSSPTPVGRLLFQPNVSTRAVASAKLDDVIGSWFGLIVWNNDPRAILDPEALSELERLGVRLIEARPQVQLGWNAEAENDVTIVGDLDGRLKRWFDAHDESVILVRPDRIIGGTSTAQAASMMVRDFVVALGRTAETAGRVAQDPGPMNAAAASPAADVASGSGVR